MLRELRGKPPRAITTSLVARAAEQGDFISQRVLRGACESLAEAICHVLALLCPRRIVIGGGVSLIGEPLRAAVEKRLPEYIMDVFHPGPPIRLAGLREDSVPVGALLMAADRLQSPTS